MSNKVCSLFSGVSGIDLAFERAGFKVIYANEIGKNASLTYELNFNTKAELHDIKCINIDKLSVFDVLVAGFPKKL